MDNNQDIKLNETPQSVGGWLLFLCVSLTILTPIYAIYIVASSFSDLSIAFDRYPGLETVYYLDLFITIGMMIFSIATGVSLWSIKPNALKTAKSFFRFYLIYIFAEAILPFLAGLPARANEIMVGEVFKSVFRQLIYYFIWTSYLRKSVRVKNTYPEEMESQVVEVVDDTNETSDKILTENIPDENISEEEKKVE